MQRLAGDPTLDGNVDTIVFPVEFEISPYEWGTAGGVVPTILVRFIIPIKIRAVPTTTST
jgi:hypothetical protein